MVTRPFDPFDMFSALSDQELETEIKALTFALTSAEQNASSWDVGSYSNKSPAEVRRTLRDMRASYARRMGLAVPKPGIVYRKVYVTKDYPA